MIHFIEYNNNNNNDNNDKYDTKIPREIVPIVVLFFL